MLKTDGEERRSDGNEKLVELERKTERKREGNRNVPEKLWKFEGLYRVSNESPRKVSKVETWRKRGRGRVELGIGGRGHSYCYAYGGSNNKTE